MDRAAKTSGITTGVYSYTTPARGSFKHCETSHDDAFVLAATADAYSMVNLICLFMNRICSRCCKMIVLSGCMRNVTAFCQHLLRPIKAVVLADTNLSIKPKYRPIYRSISNQKFGKPDLTQMQHEQNGCEKLLWPFFETNKGSTQIWWNLLTEPNK